MKKYLPLCLDTTDVIKAYKANWFSRRSGDAEALPECEVMTPDRTAVQVHSSWVKSNRIN